MTVDGGRAGGHEPAISADGRYVTFTSESSDIVAGDKNKVPDVFVRDLWNDTTELVSLNDSGDQADRASREPTISGDGRYVAFVSAGANMPDPGFLRTPHVDVYPRDMVAETTVRVSSDAANPAAGRNGESREPDISDDGRFVAYTSFADNLLTTPDSNEVSDVFWWDRLGLAAAQRVSVAGPAPELTGTSGHPSISANGMHVAFASAAPNLVGGGCTVQVHVRDLTSGARNW